VQGGASFVAVLLSNLRRVGAAHQRHRPSPRFTYVPDATPHRYQVTSPNTFAKMEEQRKGLS